MSKKKQNKYNLNSKQMKFAKNYISGMNLVDSYVDAYGGSPNRQSDRYAASRLFAKREIREYIEEIQGEIKDKFIIDKQWMVEQYLEIIQSSIEDGNINKDGTVTIDRTNWNKALAQLAKLLGLDEPEDINLHITDFVAKFGEETNEESDEEI